MADLTRLDLLILGLLADRPMHGYELHQRIQADDIDRWFPLSLPGIYYSLGKMRDLGLLVEMEGSRTGGTSRALFRVTDQGRETFFSRLESEAADPEPPILPYDLVVYFINKLPLSRAQELLEERCNHLMKWREELQAELAGGQTPAAPLLDHSLRYAQMEQEWTDCLLRGIRGEPSFGGVPSHLMLLTGDLSHYHLPDLVRLVASGCHSGTLTVTDGVVTRTITFDEERPVCGTSSRRDPDGNEIYVRDRDQVLNDLYDLFRWQEGKFSFDQTAGLTDGCFQLDLSTDQFLLEGCRWADNWETLQKRVPSPDAVFEHVTRDQRWKDLRLSSGEEAVLDQIDGVRSAAQIANDADMTLFETSRVLYGLSAVGVVRLARLDKIRLRRAFREISELVCQSTFAWRTSPEDFSCEIDVNKAASGLPIRITRSRIQDDTEPELQGEDLARLYREFLGIQLHVVGSRFGSEAADSSYQDALRHLAPELYKVADKHSLTHLTNRDNS